MQEIEIPRRSYQSGFPLRYAMLRGMRWFFGSRNKYHYVVNWFRVGRNVVIEESLPLSDNFHFVSIH
jgi:hypothetical protein